MPLGGCDGFLEESHELSVNTLFVREELLDLNMERHKL